MGSLLTIYLHSWGGGRAACRPDLGAQRPGPGCAGHIPPFAVTRDLLPPHLGLALTSHQEWGPAASAKAFHLPVMILSYTRLWVGHSARHWDALPIQWPQAWRQVVDKGHPDPGGTDRVGFPEKVPSRTGPEDGVRRQLSLSPQSSGQQDPALVLICCLLPAPTFRPAHSSFSGSFEAAGSAKLEPIPLVPLPLPLNLPKVSKSLQVVSPWL